MQRPQRARAQRLLLWLLLGLLPLQGLAGLLVQGLGALHFHMPSAAASAASSDPMQGWRDFRRQVHGEARHGHALETAPHAHDALERHHHHATDHDRVALDTAQSGEAPASGTALGQALGPLNVLPVPPLPAAREAWLAASPSSFRTRRPAPLERPPRAFL